MGKYDFGMIGLGTMGRSLLLNMADHGSAVAGLDTDPAKVDALHKEGKDLEVVGFTEAKEFMVALRKPRAIMALVPAGAPVDAVIAQMRPLMEKGDILIDGGNSFFKDTERRCNMMADAGLGFIGLGVSGGESGARHGPSMMAGGDREHYARVESLLERVSAHADGEPCVALLGPGATGHYVKMVHNGIEYGLMQVISEAYDIMKRGLGMNNAEMKATFEKWNAGELQSFLIEITADVLGYKDEKTGKHLVDLISDKAKQKGTGKWASQDSMDLGVPTPTIDIAVAAREMSGLKDQRVAAAKILGGPKADSLDRAKTLASLEGAVILSSWITYAQGFALLAAASEEYGYGLKLEVVAQVWKAGCIIRAKTLETMRQAFLKKPDLANLLVDPAVAKIVAAKQDDLRKTVITAVMAGIPVPGIGASLSYLDDYRSAVMPANLIQGQRDLFGAHTYERTDMAGSFHTQWVKE